MYQTRVINNHVVHIFKLWEESRTIRHKAVFGNAVIMVTLVGYDFSVKTQTIYNFIIWRRVFYWELNHSYIPYVTSSGTRVAYFPYVTLRVSYRSMTSRFPPFAFVELVSPHNKKNITRRLKDMNFMLSWQEQYLTCSLRSLMRYCSCPSNIKFISCRHLVISSIYVLMNQISKDCLEINFVFCLNLMNYWWVSGLLMTNRPDLQISAV